MIRAFNMYGVNAAVAFDNSRFLPGFGTLLLLTNFSLMDIQVTVHRLCWLLVDEKSTQKFPINAGFP